MLCRAIRITANGQAIFPAINESCRTALAEFNYKVNIYFGLKIYMASIQRWLAFNHNSSGSKSLCAHVYFERHSREVYVFLFTQRIQYHCTVSISLILLLCLATITSIEFMCIGGRRPCMVSCGQAECWRHPACPLSNGFSDKG